MLVREGFSWGALLFGPLWLAVHRAWIAAVLALAASVLIVVLAKDAYRGGVAGDADGAARPVRS